MQPLPILQVVLLGQVGSVEVFLGVALEDAGCHQEQGVVHGVDQGFCVVDDQVVRADALVQPRDEVLAWGGGSVGGEVVVASGILGRMSISASSGSRSGG